jgi:hypothetical protein
MIHIYPKAQLLGKAIAPHLNRINSYKTFGLGGDRKCHAGSIKIDRKLVRSYRP